MSFFGKLQLWCRNLYQLNHIRNLLEGLQHLNEENEERIKALARHVDSLASEQRENRFQQVSMQMTVDRFKVHLDKMTPPKKEKKPSKPKRKK